MILRDGKIDYAKLGISKKEEKLKFKKMAISCSAKDDNYVMYSEVLNHYLLETPNIPLRCSKKNSRIKSFIRNNQELLLKFLTYNIWHSFITNKIFLNEKKLCLSRDIDPSEKLIYLHKGDFYDSFLTNEVSNKYLENTENGKHIADARCFAPFERNDDENVLKDITTSSMNNHIGASTLAFTKDNYIVFWAQNLKAQTNKDLLMPTGSGSTNADDLVDNDLSKTITKTMERELYEESSLLKKKITCKTKITGFYRWINRGGKPEFTGISKLNCSIQSLAPNSQEVKVYFENSHLNREYVASMKDLPKIIKKILKRDNISVSLAMCLKFLENYSLKHSKELKEFLELQN